MPRSFHILLLACALAGAAHAVDSRKTVAQFHAAIVKKAGSQNAAPLQGPAFNAQLTPYGAILEAARWPSSSIPVCWENPAPEHAQAMEWTRDAVRQTWEKASRVRFTGWQRCAAINKGVRIRIADTGPLVISLGKLLDGKKNGMLLNFTFQNWRYHCRETREDCIRAVAVHEFGHALGLTHEQNRPDTPGECAIQAAGTTPDKLLTPYDPESIMNYCNWKWLDGKLSKDDITAVATMYGAA